MGRPCSFVQIVESLVELDSSGLGKAVVVVAGTVPERAAVEPDKLFVGVVVGSSVVVLAWVDVTVALTLVVVIVELVAVDRKDSETLPAAVAAVRVAVRPVEQTLAGTLSVVAQVGYKMLELPAGIHSHVEIDSFGLLERGTLAVVSNKTVEHYHSVYKLVVSPAAHYIAELFVELHQGKV